MSLMKFEKRFFLHTRTINSNDKLKASGALDYFQDIAGLHAEKLGIGYDYMKKKNLAWVILGSSFEILDAKTDILTEIDITTWPKLPGKIEVEREYEIRNNNGELVCHGDSSWCLIDLSKRTITRANNVEFIGEYVDFTRYPNGVKRKLGLKLDNPDMEYHHLVEASEIDHNGHLNNAKYLDLVENMLGIAYNISKCDISFIHEAKLGDEMIIKHQKIDGFDCFVGYVEATLAFECKIIIKENI